MRSGCYEKFFIDPSVLGRGSVMAHVILGFRGHFGSEGIGGEWVGGVAFYELMVDWGLVEVLARDTLGLGFGSY